MLNYRTYNLNYSNTKSYDPDTAQFEYSTQQVSAQTIAVLSGIFDPFVGDSKSLQNNFALLTKVVTGGWGGTTPNPVWENSPKISNPVVTANPVSTPTLGGVSIPDSLQQKRSIKHTLLELEQEHDVAYLSQLPAFLPKTGITPHTFFWWILGTMLLLWWTIVTVVFRETTIRKNKKM